MIDHRVGELHVQVRAPPGAEVGLRSTAEGFARSVLERLAERLDAAAPDRFMFIRELSLRWRLEDRLLEDSATAERCAGEIVERVRDALPLGLEIRDADTSGDLAIFHDESHWRAAYLLAKARGALSQAWFFSALEQERDPLETLASPKNPALARAVLERLAAEGHLIEVVAKGPSQRWTVLAERLLDGQFVVSPQPDVGTSRTPPPSIPEGLIGITSSLPPDLPQTLAALVLQTHARVLIEPDPDEIASLVRHCLALREQIRKGSATGEAGVPGANDARRQPEITDSESDAAIPLNTDQEPTQETEAADAALVRVQLGGLFYLLNCALELNLGETLWKACLPEQKILAHAAAALVGEELKNDPGISLFAGSGPDPPVPSVTEDQLNEVSDALLIALCTALPRRGLAQLPQTMLSVEYQGRASLLVARPISSPFAIFAMPAPTPDAARTALEAFLAHWSRSAPAPLVSPGLAELDASGRLRPTHQAGKPPAALLPEAPSAPATALLAQTIGVLCFLLQARAGATDLPNADSFVEKYVQLPAQVRNTSEELTVTLPADAAKVELRRAGLDRNPGWVPWLQKTVRFEFMDPDDEPAVPD